MTALIRFPDETDAEYQRRTRPVLAMLNETLRESSKRWSVAGALAHSKLYQHMRLSELRRSCGVLEDETFTWQVHDGSA